MIYEIIGIVWGVAILWCILEFMNSPIYPADFINRVTMRRKAKRRSKR